MTKELQLNLSLISDKKQLIKVLVNPLVLPLFIEMVEESEQLPNARKELTNLKEALTSFQDSVSIENFLRIWEYIEILSQ